MPLMLRDRCDPALQSPSAQTAVPFRHVACLSSLCSAGHWSAARRALGRPLGALIPLHTPQIPHSQLFGTMLQHVAALTQLFQETIIKFASPPPAQQSHQFSTACRRCSYELDASLQHRLDRRQTAAHQAGHAVLARQAYDVGHKLVMEDRPLVIVDVIQHAGAASTYVVQDSHDQRFVLRLFDPRCSHQRVLVCPAWDHGIGLCKWIAVQFDAQAERQACEGRLGPSSVEYSDKAQSVTRTL